jgi:hypothetical protein
MSKIIFACALPHNQQERQKYIRNYKISKIGRDICIAIVLLISMLTICARVFKLPRDPTAIANLLVSVAGLSMTHQSYRRVNGKPILKLMLSEERKNPLEK